MPTAVIRYKVRDYRTWFSSFIAREPQMRQIGVIGINIRQTLDDPNDVILNFRINDLERFKSVITDPSTRALMEADGVVSQADIVFCTDPVGRQGGTPGRPR
jgi:hypothetical protein